jgi:hypothetical protein
LLVLDEAWIFLDHPLFAARIREWLKTLRKKNVAVLFATQSLADIASSTHRAGDHRELPPAGLAAQRSRDRAAGREAYARFGFNDRQIELVSRATPSANIIFSPRAATGCSSWAWAPSRSPCAAPPTPPAQKRIDAILAEHGSADFASNFLSDPPVSTGPRTCSPTFPVPDPHSRRNAVMQVPLCLPRRRSSPRSRLRRLGRARHRPVATSVTPAHAQFTVFDPSNYSQNILTAARTLQQINNQIKALQNQAQSLHQPSELNLTHDRLPRAAGDYPDDPGRSTS